MFYRFQSRALPCLLLSAATLSAYVPGSVQAGEPPRETVTASRLPPTPQSTAHVEAARAAANGDEDLLRTWSFFCTPTNYNAPGPALEPVKVFDNLYLVSSSPRQLTTVWAITTRDGIILIDSGDQAQPDAVLSGMQKLGLDPAQVKAILLGHGHGDHYAGSLYFQERYGTRVGTASMDWDLMYPATPPANAPANPLPRPKRDLVLEAGTPFVLGEQTVHVYSAAGHTPGSLAFVFTVTEGGRSHAAALFGGTILDQGRIPTEGLNQYIDSIEQFQNVARQMNVAVGIQNHALFDSTPERLARLGARRPGDPNPFLGTTDKFVRLWDIAAECIRAEIAKR